MNDWTVRKDKMEERYRKIICPNGHYSDPIKENEPLPRRCIVCRQQYLKTSKPVWCDKDGNEIFTETNTKLTDSEKEDKNIGEVVRENSRKQHHFDIQIKDDEEHFVHRRRRTFEKDDKDNLQDFKKHELAEEKRNVTVLKTGEMSITLEGEGILGRENQGAEILAVNRLGSRSHCYYIVTKQCGVLIRDAGSLNGTFADTGNGRVAVDQEKGVELKNGDKLWLADMLFEVREA